MFSQATKNFAAGMFIVGMLLIGFGFLVYILRELFAVLFAIIFCVSGIGCIIKAVKLFCFQSRINKNNPNDHTETYRDNVSIHSRQYDDV